MNLPKWILEEIFKFDPPKTGKVIVELELYMGGVTKMEIGGHVRVKPEVNQEREKQTQFAKA